MAHSFTDIKLSDKTKRDSITCRRMWIRQQNNEKNQKKIPRESWNHISNQDAVLHVPWTPFPSFFFSHHFSIGFFSCLQLWSSFYSSSFWELKRFWISDTSLDSRLSTKHRLKSNLILSLSLRWLESSIYNWAGLKLLCP